MRLVIIGAGGCAREVAWTVRESSLEGTRFEVLGYVVSDVNRLGERDSKSEVLGDFDWLGANRSYFDGVLLGVGSPQTRFALAEEVSSRYPDLSWPPVVHPSVQMDRSSVLLEAGVVICANSVVTVNVKLRRHALIHYCCTVSHESVVGTASVLNPCSTVSGGVSVGNRVLIGAGARVLQYRSIGDDAVVGAGAIVTRNVAPGSTVVGVPARPSHS